MARELLSPADQETYGVEALDFADALGWIDDQAYEVLDDIEKQIRALLGDDMTLAWFIVQIVRGGRAASSVPMLRTRLWLALRCTGSELALADFRPHVYSVREEKPEVGDAGPPSESAESSSTSTTPTDTEPSATPTSG